MARAQDLEALRPWLEPWFFRANVDQINMTMFSIVCKKTLNFCIPTSQQHPSVNLSLESSQTQVTMADADSANMVAEPETSQTTIATGHPARTIIPSSRLLDGNNQEAPLTSSHCRAIAAAQAASATSHTVTSTSTPTSSASRPPAPPPAPPSICPTAAPTNAGPTPPQAIFTGSSLAPINTISNSEAIRTQSTSKRASVEDAESDDNEIVPLQCKRAKTAKGK